MHHAGVFDEACCFFRVGQQLAVIENAFRANAVFFAGLAGFQRTEAADFTFHRYAAGMRQGHHVLVTATL